MGGGFLDSPLQTGVVCVTKYIDFFNNERPHKYLNYLTPAKKEELFYAQTQAE